MLVGNRPLSVESPAEFEQAGDAELVRARQRMYVYVAVNIGLFYYVYHL